ncbi:unnamed protein product [Hydatigera taeniaeformis]|uniref:Transforming acidic coiled-coil-containing protein C-terminal domain-containing protein n=1 Tax=Hydatigena taeniaeformis TaxID=6205 RepID=A0A0R3WYJ1_HYDTA|nr:unnamed protein product [Hydatigera taeniaeformis]
MSALSARNSELAAELQKLALEKQDSALIFKKCEEILTNQVSNIRTSHESLDILLKTGFQMNFGLEEELERTNIELLKMKVLNEEKERQVAESFKKCSQLSDDLSQVYALLQNSKDSCLEKGKKIASLEEAIKKLTEEKDFIQNDLIKKSSIYETEVRSRQKELMLLTDRLKLTILSFNSL